MNSKLKELIEFHLRKPMRNRKALPDRDLLRSLLDYNSETGSIRWKITKPGLCEAGSEAGWNGKFGYLMIGINRKTYQAHRLIWVIMSDEPVPEYIDHIDRSPSNNRWSNLRRATSALNNLNSSNYRHNTSGIRGVSFHKASNKWRASISFQDKHVALGVFPTKEEAAEAYRRAKSKQEVTEIERAENSKTSWILAECIKVSHHAVTEILSCESGEKMHQIAGRALGEVEAIIGSEK